MCAHAHLLYVCLCVIMCVLCIVYVMCTSLCVHMCIQMPVHMRVLLCGGLKLMLSIFLVHSPPYFVEQDVSLDLEPIVQIGCLASDCQGLACLLLPQQAFQMPVSVPGVLCGCWGSELDPVDCLRHFTKGAIFPTKGFCVVLRDANT